MLNKTILTVKIGGQAGQGIKSAGLLLSKIATRSGYYIYNYTEYPSLIRGGHNTIQVSISQDEVTAPSQKTDLLVALNQETIDKHLGELLPGSGILYDDRSSIDINLAKEREVNLFSMPLKQLVDEGGGEELLSNTIALGAVAALLGGELSILKDLISEQFAAKEQQIIESNQKAAELGFNFALEKFKDQIKQVIPKLASFVPKMVLNGNDGVALGAIAGGVQFAAIYPMSPISNILHTLALYQERYGYIYKQPEDEISAINMAIGAAFAGARSMTATSGGGFCLMSEGYGLAGMTETPVVIIDGMRPGPATGLATWSGQGDLQFVLHAHQGDFPKIVLAAGDVKETFDLTMQAFNLAEKYQTPVVILIDKNICEDEQSLPLFDISSYEVKRGKIETQNNLNYQRYALEADGVSKRASPGSGNYFIANSYEHDSTGFSTENIDDINSQMKKRMAKLKLCSREDLPAPQLFGPKEADVTLVSWGSNKGSILQALKEFSNVNFLHLTWLNPFPIEAVRNILSEARYIIDIECNYSGQLAGLIREQTGIEIFDKLLKYNGRPIFPEEIKERLRGVLKKV